jgi:hypothetical protein
VSKKDSYWRGQKNCSAQLAREGNHSPQAEKKGPCTPYKGKPSIKQQLRRIVSQEELVQYPSSQMVGNFIQ